MGRHRRASEGGALIAAMARLPWPVCLALAPLSWMLFHWMAQLEPPHARDIEQFGDSIAVMVFKTAGMFGQYLMPFAFVLAALIAWLSKRRRERLLSDAESRKGSAPLRTLTWRDFEQLVGAHFERQGYRVTFTPDGADGGVDAIASKDGESYLIQCKQWRATKVGVAVVRELFGVMAARGATGGFVVSIGAFTREAHAFARGRNVELVDAHALIGADNAGQRHAAKREPASAAGAMCPGCGSPMVRRTAKRGSDTGRVFYGCSRYPACTVTRPA